MNEKTFRLNIHQGCAPLLYSIKATKPEASE